MNKQQMLHVALSQQNRSCKTIVGGSADQLYDHTNAHMHTQWHSNSIHSNSHLGCCH